VNQSPYSSGRQMALSKFLYSEVAEQPNSVPVTVLSALARYGLDPWHEADRLARLPATLAVENLGQVIAPALPFDTPPHKIKAQARRLIRSLPAPNSDKIAPKVVTPPERQRRIIGWGMIGIISGSVALGGLYLTTQNFVSATPSAWIGVNSTHADASPQPSNTSSLYLPQSFAERIQAGYPVRPPPSAPSRP
jgi:hypothetical protein